MKKLLTLFLAICMICILLPFGALAASDYGICIGGIMVTDANKNDVLKDGTVKFDSSTNTITLNNANITTVIGMTDPDTGDVAYSSILIDENAGDVNIVLIGDNKIAATCPKGASGCIGIEMDSPGKLTFSGSGSLSVTSKGRDPKTLCVCSAVFAYDMDIKGGTLNFTSGEAYGEDYGYATSEAMFCYGTLNISDGTVKATAGKSSVSEAVFVGALKMTGGKLTAVAEKSDGGLGGGIYVDSNNFNVTGGTLVAQGDVAIIAWNAAAGDDMLVYKCPKDGKVYAGADSGAKAWDGKTTFDNFKYVKIDFDKNPFVDVKSGSYCYEPVLWAYNHKPQVTAGVDKTHFAPDNNCTRAQIVTFLWRAKGCPEVKGAKNPFKDVKSSDYYYDAVLWAVSKNITTGIDKTHFAPNNTCTRGQAVTFLWRAKENPKPASTKCPFNDVKTSDYYYNAVLWAVGKNITNGVDKTHFAPNNTCTRGQIVTFLYRDMK